MVAFLPLLLSVVLVDARPLGSDKAPVERRQFSFPGFSFPGFSFPPFPTPTTASSGIANISATSSVSSTDSVSTSPSANSTASNSSSIVPTSTISPIPQPTVTPNYTDPYSCRSPGTSGYNKLTNKANCRVNVSSANIDDPDYGLQVVTINNWGNGNIPPALRGIFYFEGNPYEAECFSSAAGYWNDTYGSLDLAMYQPRVWSSDAGTNQLKGNLQRGAVFQTKCKVNFFNRLDCTTQEWDIKNDKIMHAGDYTATEVADNRWVRGSNVRDINSGGDIGPTYPGTNISLLRYSYNMYRIVDEFGVRTSRFYNNYLPNINRTIGVSGQINVHLGPSQEVPIIKPTGKRPTTTSTIVTPTITPTIPGTPTSVPPTSTFVPTTTTTPFTLSSEPFSTVDGPAPTFRR